MGEGSLRSGDFVERKGDRPVERVEATLRSLGRRQAVGVGVGEAARRARGRAVWAIRVSGRRWSCQAVQSF